MFKIIIRSNIKLQVHLSLVYLIIEYKTIQGCNALSLVYLNVEYKTTDVIQRHLRISDYTPREPHYIRENTHLLA